MSEITNIGTEQIMEAVEEVIAVAKPSKRFLTKKHGYIAGGVLVAGGTLYVLTKKGVIRWPNLGKKHRCQEAELVADAAEEANETK